jgi:alpha-N-acetylglucosaminidase
VVSRAAAILLVLSAAAAPLPAASTTSAARGLVRRRLPAQQAGQFRLEEVSPERGNDVFEIESVGNRVVLRGNNGVALASALNCYLKEYCHCEVSWNCGNQLEVPRRLPPVSHKVRVVSPHKFRYAYNYCTHGYTMAWWDWPRWERELDFLALRGVNLALVIEGQEGVWLNTLRTFGYMEAELRQ